MHKRRLSLHIALALGITAAGTAGAQESTKTEGGAAPTPGEAVTADDVDRSSGWAAGGFRFFPQLSVTALYDSNIYGVNGSVPVDKWNDPSGPIQEETSDTVGILTPSLAVRSDWERHELNFNAGANLARYRDNDDEDYNDYWLNADGRYDINERSNVFGGLGISRDHEDRTSPEGAAGVEPIQYDSLDAHGGYARRIGQTVLRLGGTAQRIDYEDGVNADGTEINHDDRDRDIYALGARLTYLQSAQIRPFVQASAERRRYETDRDDYGFERDSDGYRAAAGIDFNYGPTLEGEVYAGVLHQSFDDPRFDSITRPDFGARLTWQATPFTRVRGSVDRSLEETTYWQFADGAPDFASSYLYSRAEVLAEHRLTPRTTLSALASYGQAEYQNVDRTDDLIGAGFGVEYKLSRNLLLQLDYRHYQRDSDYRDPFNYKSNQDVYNGDLFDGNYQRDQVYLRLKALLYPVRDTPVVAGTFSGLGETRGAGLGGGFYAGAQAGISGLATATEGPRGNQGNDEADMAGQGWTSGLFAGWGMTNRDHWYGGVEIEGARSGADWSHAKNKSSSRTFSLDMNDSWGASLRGGRVLSNGSLLYARAGLVRSEFDTYYQANDAPANAADDSDRQTGKRFGVGVDVPAGKHLFWRMDYSITDYDDYDVVYDTTRDSIENFHTREGLFRIGLGWRFGAQDYQVVDPTDGDISGFYAGAQIGRTQLRSDLDAIHNDGGSNPGRSRLTADFGDAGASAGIFAGYGWQWDRVYFGLEADVENSNAEWQHVRTPTGRNFSLEQKGGQALSARLGYQLDNGTLLYARLGKARSQFNYRYVKGGDRRNDINRDEMEIGNRYGLGAEVPLTPNTFVRFDYNRTDYGELAFETTHGNTDTVSLDNETDEFRLGVGYRF
ncbi:outer membrane beta-barrel protein [Guyparkeria hydrothermalis]|uniref:outer membrane beta-barrel protein n=1 Tax=Guyparkeria hydrothermalis TaxID=923 RepID=UPI002020514D|nr:outer membrane beta-barrel protein [Guyparkeria hydrothermalis]MCL7744120.1 outer membrane beta-barrel protein [Guyparkeria hydrothermalis]